MRVKKIVFNPNPHWFKFRTKATASGCPVVGEGRGAFSTGLEL
jgi:hypothetical protein